MNYRVTVLTLLFVIFGFSSASATDRHAKATAGATSGQCLTTGTACTIAYALTVAQQGDTIILAAGAYAEGELVIDKDFITIQGALFATAPEVAPRDPLSAGSCRTAVDAESCIDLLAASDKEFAFKIAADNVTITGIEINGDPAASWAGIVVEETTVGLNTVKGQDRWTVSRTAIHDIGFMIAGSARNYSYGIYADAQSTAGNEVFTGGEIAENLFFALGGQSVTTPPAVDPGLNETAGVGVYLAGTNGNVDKCDSINKFACGAWIHANVFEDLFRGVTVANFSELVDGRERSVGVMVVQDSDNPLQNNGVLVESNVFLANSIASEPLDIGVWMGIGNSSVVQTNTSFTDDPVMYVVNDGRAATIDELSLAPFFKSTNPNPQSLLGPDSDAYFFSKSQAGILNDAEDSSAPSATIVSLNTGSASTLEVYPGGETTSVRVSVDNDGDLNVREGAKLLYDNPFQRTTASIDGVSLVKLNGTAGDDLLTLDFSNGNPIPEGGLAAACTSLVGTNSDKCGIEFDGADGFDKVILRGSEQVLNQTYVMGGGSAPEGTGSIYFEPYLAGGPPTPVAAPGADFVAELTTIVNFLNIEPIDDVIITNGTYAVVAPNGTDHEVNVVEGPTVFGQSTYQINSGANATFEKINFRNKKDVEIYGGDGDDVLQAFTLDGTAPALLQNIDLFGQAGDDYIVVRPSEDFPYSADGGAGVDDWIFIDCADVDNCTPLAAFADATLTFTNAQDVTIANFDRAPAAYSDNDFVIAKSVDTFGDAHPGDVVTFTITVTNNNTGGGFVTDFSGANASVWVSDVIDHRFSLDEQSIVVDAGTVDVTANRAMLWEINDPAWVDTETFTMTYDVIVNTLLTTDDIVNWGSVLNLDGELALTDHYSSTTVDVATVFGFPAKAAIQASVFAPTKAGPRYIVGLFGGALDPATLNIGAVMCRVPDQNKAVGWDGGLGNLWYSCGEGLPAKDGLFSPLVVTDLFRDQSGRIWLTSWGFNGLYRSDDDGKTWTAQPIDIGGGPGNAPDGTDDPFNQIYAISEDINGTLFISANNGDVLRSFDGGTTWQRAKQLPLGSADTPWSLEADPTTPGKLYAGTFGDSLYVTTDFGETWNKPDGNGLGNGNIFDIEFDPLSGNLFVGTALGVYYTADEGDNWVGLNSAFPEPNVPPEVRHVAFDENGVFFAGTWGQGVWVSQNWQGTALSEFALKSGEVADIAFGNGGVYILTSGAEMIRFDRVEFASSVDTDNPATELPKAYSLNQNYPNPFGAQTTIQFALPASQDVRLEVYDVLGRRVALLVDGPMSAGEHEVRFSAPNLSNGMYLYRLSTPTGSETKSMVLLK